MQVFDYHINPKLKKGLSFGSFYSQPENQEQKNLGNLCIIAELANSVPRDSKIINELGNTIKQEFFSNSKRSSEEALKEALKKANKFLEDLAQQGNVRWLGNLNLAVLAVKDFNINFSKTGNINLLLLRAREYHDIGQNLEFQQPTSDKPIQLFSNVAVGQLAEKDKIIVLTQDIFDFFHTNLAGKIMDLQELSSRAMNKMIRARKEEMKNFSGILYLLFISHPIRKRMLSLPRINLSFLPSSAALRLRKIKREILLIIALILILFISYLIFR